MTTQAVGEVLTTWRTITIPYPGPIPRNRGIHAVNHSRGKMHIDFTPDEFRVIEQAAAMVGITKSEYMRWVGAFAAREIINAQGSVQSVPPE